MDGLRLALIAAGIVILALIYILGVRRQSKDADVFGPETGREEVPGADYDPLFAPPPDGVNRRGGAHDDLDLSDLDAVKAVRPGHADDGLGLDEWDSRAASRETYTGLADDAPMPAERQAQTAVTRGEMHAPHESAMLGGAEPESARELYPPASTDESPEAEVTGSASADDSVPRRRVAREGLADVVTRAIELDGDGLFNEGALDAGQIEQLGPNEPQPPNVNPFKTSAERRIDTSAEGRINRSAEGWNERSDTQSADELATSLNNELRGIAEDTAGHAGQPRTAPELGNLDAVTDADEPTVLRDPHEDTAPPAEFVIVLNVMTRAQVPFSGTEIRKALENAGLRHGEMDMFHYPRMGPNAASAGPMFSAANALRPGTLAPDELATLTTPGIALFMRVHDARTAGDDLKTLLRTAQMVAARLGGNVCDEARVPLNNQAINGLKEKVAAFNRQSARHQ